MAIWYVKKMDKNVNLLTKILKPINIINVQNKIIAEIPSEKYAKKLLRRIYDKENQNLVIMDNLNNDGFNGICNILNGRWLFKYIIPNVLEYIAKTSKMNLQEQEIALMINNYNQNILKMLVQIAQTVKMMNIITDKIDGFTKLESYLLSEKGIAIHISNNKRKALMKSSIIINFDFSEEQFNKFCLPTKSIIISTNGKIAIKTKRFEGINCNYYGVVLPQEYAKWFKENNLLGLTDETILLESMLYYKKSYEDIVDKVNNVKIQYLVGNNGIIKDEEFLPKETKGDVSILGHLP